MKQHENLDLVMDVTNRGHVIENLEHNTVDFSLLPFLPASPAVDKLDLVPNKLFVVGRGGSETKLRKTPYPTSHLKELHLIFREKGSSTRQAMEDYIKHSHLDI